MAGLYADVPAPRMAYDRDGTIGFRMTSGFGAYQTLTLAQMQGLNDEAPSGYTFTSNQSYWVGFLFPQLRTLAGVMYCIRWDNQTIQVQTSVNTTNGIDGTWTGQPTLASQSETGGTTIFRTDIRSVSLSSVKAVRFQHNDNGGNSGDMLAVHLYGRINDTETPDRLRFWHPTLDEPLDDNTAADGAWLDFAESTRGTTADKSFRIKNNSSTLTANSINITNNALTDTTPSVPPQFTFSNGGAFATSLDIGNLGPGALSSVITIRRTTPSNAALSLWWTRVMADPTSWS